MLRKSLMQQTFAVGLQAVNQPLGKVMEGCQCAIPWQACFCGRTDIDCAHKMTFFIHTVVCEFIEKCLCTNGGHVMCARHGAQWWKDIHKGHRRDSG